MLFLVLPTPPEIFQFCLAVYTRTHKKACMSLQKGGWTPPPFSQNMNGYAPELLA